jgi:FAD/FMN-containing dehydrogenase
LAGKLVLPSQAPYATARLLYDPRFDAAHPAAVAYCASPVDVQRTIEFARTHALQPIPRCGGHSYGGYSTGSGLVIDVSAMNTVSVTTAGASGAGTGGPGALATVGGGTRLVDLYAGVASAGVLVPGGSCPTVGIAGLALGGGIGVLARRYGLTCDALQSLTAVTADSRVLDADATSEPDLFWASRGGGGGNFAIATSFVFAAAPIPPVAIFTLDFPWAAAGDLLGAWQAWVAQAPDELWSNCLLLSQGTAGLLARTAGVYAGAVADLDPLLNALVGAVATTPSSRVAFASSYLQAMLLEAGCAQLTLAQCHLPAVNPAGQLPRSAFLAKSAYVSTAFDSSGLTAATSAVASFASELPTLGGGLAFDSAGGAINAVAPDATAFVHRRALCQIQMTASLPNGTAGPASEAAGAWLAATDKALAPHTDGQAYQNYIDPTLADWQAAYYGTNLPRLISIKRAYDPDDVFHFAQSIPTSA